MINLNVKTLFLDKVAIRDKYIREAESIGEGITITHGDATMTIPSREIRYKIAGRSEHPFYDKFNNEKHYLVYFDWKPDSHQYNFLS